MLPVFSDVGFCGRFLMGEWHGLKSAVGFPSETLCVDLELFQGGEIEAPASVEERALSSMNGPIVVDGIIYPESELLVLAPGRGIRLLAASHWMDFATCGGISCQLQLSGLNKPRMTRKAVDFLECLKK